MRHTLVPVFCALCLCTTAAPARGSPSADDGQIPDRAADDPPPFSVQCIATPKDEADPQPFVFRFSRTSDFEQPLVIWIKTGGTMTPGADYVPPPAFIVIPVGRAHVDLFIQGIDDDLAEGVETIEISGSLQPPPPRPATRQASQPVTPPAR